jgi:hypothetical protein
MAEITKETIVTQTAEPVTVVTAEPALVSPSQTIEYVVYFLFGVLDVLLVFRFILKLLGANTASAFVRFIYSLSGIFIWPFEGIFRRGVAPGIETASVFEPATIMALVVYAIAAWGVVTLIRVLSREQPAV